MCPYVKYPVWPGYPPKAASPHQCTIRLSSAALVVGNVDPTPANNTPTVEVTVTTR